MSRQTVLACMAAWVRFDPCKPFVRCFATARCPMFPEGCQGKTKRRRFGYNVATVLAEREAVPPELRNMDDWRTRHNPKGKFTAQALLHVERSNTWDGPLSPWSDEAALQRCFLGYPLDAYVVKVTHVFHLPDSRPLFTRISTKGEEVALTLRSDSLVFLRGVLIMESQEFQEGQQGGCAPAESLATKFQERLGSDPWGTAGRAICVRLVAQTSWRLGVAGTLVSNVARFSSTAVA